MNLFALIGVLLFREGVGHLLVAQIINNWFYMSVRQRLLESLFYTIVLYASLGAYTVCFVQS